MTGAPGEYRLYTDLAGWWPLISPVTEYAEEASYLAGVFRTAANPVREVLDLGSGGGHVAAHLRKAGLALTLVDLSEKMLAVSRRLNPGCAHLQGDMRTIRLGRAFDAVLVHDAIDYVTCQADLATVIQTAYAHCRPGGIAVFVPDHVRDTFRAGSGGGGSGDGAGRLASFREWTWDPDPADDWVQAEYEFVLSAPDTPVEVVRETHRLGAFRRDTWRCLLSEAGFDPLFPSSPQSGDPQSGDPHPGAGAVTGPGQGAQGHKPRNLFAGRRPAGLDRACAPA